jgi:RNA polymerase primary sigma factor
VNERLTRLALVARGLSRELGRDASLDELAARMEMSVDTVAWLQKVARAPISLETPVGSDGDAHLGDFVEDGASVSPLDSALATSLSAETERILATLTPREQKVLRMRFGIGGRSEKTLADIGEAFGVTRERIRQIEAKALKKLRHGKAARRMLPFSESA